MIKNNEEMLDVLNKVIDDRLYKRESSYNLLLVRDYLLSKDIKDKKGEGE